MCRLVSSHTTAYDFRDHFTNFTVMKFLKDNMFEERQKKIGKVQTWKMLVSCWNLYLVNLNIITC